MIKFLMPLEPVGESDSLLYKQKVCEIVIFNPRVPRASSNKKSFTFASASYQLTFGAGVYTGIYITQNYEVPRVDEPAKLWDKTSEKVKDFLDQHKKP